MVVGAWWARLSISEPADLMGLSRIKVCRVYAQWCEKQSKQHPNNIWLCRQKCLVVERG